MGMYMTKKLEILLDALKERFGSDITQSVIACGELTVEVTSQAYQSLMFALRDEAPFLFEEIIDLCGVDYATYVSPEGVGKPRFAVVSHLLSLTHNVRLRVRVFAENEQFPVVQSVTPVWSSANWFEREAFDLFGIVFEGHEDLRRILTDYGFIGHPFRKDFPVSGHVEMRYDPDQGRVIYQPVTIEPRENTPRVVRESTFGDC